MPDNDNDNDNDDNDAKPETSFVNFILSFDFHICTWIINLFQVIIISVFNLCYTEHLDVFLTQFRVQGLDVKNLQTGISRVGYF